MIERLANHMTVFCAKFYFPIMFDMINIIYMEQLRQIQGVSGTCTFGIYLRCLAIS